MSTEDQPQVHRVCVSCGADRLMTLKGFEAAHLVRCGRCGLAFAGRQPTERELESHYSGYGDWPDSQLTRQRYREVLADFEPYRSTGRIFDMGCGAGYFLEEAAAAGWEPHGSTVGALSIEMCRSKGLHVVSAAEVASSLPDGQFDVATAFEVVEHLRVPEVEARQLARLVRPGGLLYLTTPNFNSLSRRVLGSDWRVISYPEHLLYFTDATLRSWLERVGFRPIGVQTTGLSPGELRRALHTRRHASTEARTASGARAVRGVDDRLRQAAETGTVLPTVKSALNSALTRFGAGDTLKAWFVRDPSA